VLRHLPIVLVDTWELRVFFSQRHVFSSIARYTRTAETRRLIAAGSSEPCIKIVEKLFLLGKRQDDIKSVVFDDFSICLTKREAANWLTLLPSILRCICEVLAIELYQPDLEPLQLVRTNEGKFREPQTKEEFTPERLLFLLRQESS
jgi:hypothetical protein